MKLGVDVIEFDVHMTNYGHLVSIHDATVEEIFPETPQMSWNIDIKDTNKPGLYRLSVHAIQIPTTDSNIQLKDYELITRATKKE